MLDQMALNSSDDAGPWRLRNMVVDETGGYIPATNMKYRPRGSELLGPVNGDYGEGLDTAFLVTRDSPDRSSSVAGSHASIDMMRVAGRKFKTLSDHFAVTFTLGCSGNLTEE